MIWEKFIIFGVFVMVIYVFLSLFLDVLRLIDIVIESKLVSEKFLDRKGRRT